MKLEFVSVSAAYRGKTVLEDVSLCAESGKITVLLGRNGVGKSTLLSCLNGQKQDHRGVICLDAVPVTSLDAAKRASCLAFLPQQLPAPRVTVEQLVAFGRAPYLSLTGKLMPQDEAAVAEALARVGIADLACRLVDSLSGGERKKAFLAMVLAQDTPLVVLDEPTAHLDVAARFELQTLLRQLCTATGKTFLVVMHELPEALHLADRIAVLDAGRIAFYGTGETFVTRGIAESCFGVRLQGSAAEGYTVLPK